MAKKDSYVGIDLGGSSLKVVELKNVNNRPQLVTYGFIDETYNIVKDESKEAQTELANHLKKLLRSSRVSTDKAIAALPSFSVFSSIISLPAMSKKDLISAVRWEAKKFVPIPLEEMILDWEMLKEEKHAEVPVSDTADETNKNDEPPEGEEQNEQDEKKDTVIQKDAGKKDNIKVLLTAAPKNLVNRYVELFKNANLQLVSLETESFALERSLIGIDQNPIMIIDIGNAATSIIIYSGGVPILNRSIDVGGQTVTKALVESMGVSEAQAEQFKRDIGSTITGDSIEELPRPIRYMINAIMNEIRYILNIYQSRNQKQISKIVLTGGSAFLANLTKYLYSVFNVKAYIGNPWARVVHPIELDAMLRQLGPRLSVSIGLAMREIL